MTACEVGTKTQLRLGALRRIQVEILVTSLEDWLSGEVAKEGERKEALLAA